MLEELSKGRRRPADDEQVGFELTEARQMSGFQAIQTRHSNFDLQSISDGGIVPCRVNRFEEREDIGEPKNRDDHSPEAMSVHGLASFLCWILMLT